MTRPLRVVIADDHALVRAGLRALVEAEAGLAVVGEAADGEDAWRRTCDLLPDVLLLDLSMPRVDGVEAAARVARDCPGVRVLVLTMHEEQSYLTRLLDVGAAGYLLKRTVAQELGRAIRAVAAGERYVDPSLSDGRMPGKGAESEGRVPEDRGEAPGEVTSELTDREAAVLHRVAQGYSNREIADALGLEVADVEAHKGDSMRKLGLRTRAAVVRFAADQGWAPRTG